jgi:hypothetical protein
VSRAEDAWGSNTAREARTALTVTAQLSQAKERQLRRDRLSQ